MSTLGDVKDSWQNMTMKFDYQGREICLRGEPSLIRREIIKASLHKAWISRRVGGFGPSSGTILRQEGLRTKLYFGRWRPSFLWLCSPPNRLPTRREVDHHIPLQSRVSPVSVILTVTATWLRTRWSEWCRRCWRLELYSLARALFQPRSFDPKEG